MRRLLKIGIVGCGAIGSSLAKIIVSDFSHQAKLMSLYDIKIERANKLARVLNLNNQKLVVLNLEDLINKVDLVVEATEPLACFAIAKKTILASCDIMIMSTGAIIKRYKELEILARKKNVQVFIPSGAICGLDGLKAAKALGEIKKVILTTQKPAQAFSNSPFILKKGIQLDKIVKDTLLFEGSADLAVEAFPQNINVAATLSIAGMGSENTFVRIVASPGITRNIHEIEIESDAGRIVTRTENVIHPDNPKTSYLAVLSAVATLKQILEPIKIGT